MHDRFIVDGVVSGDVLNERPRKEREEGRFSRNVYGTRDDKGTWYRSCHCLLTQVLISKACIFRPCEEDCDMLLASNRLLGVKGPPNEYQATLEKLSSSLWLMCLMPYEDPLQGCITISIPLQVCIATRDRCESRMIPKQPL